MINMLLYGAKTCRRLPLQLGVPDTLVMWPVGDDRFSPLPALFFESVRLPQGLAVPAWGSQTHLYLSVVSELSVAEGHVLETIVFPQNLCFPFSKDHMVF